VISQEWVNRDHLNLKTTFNLKHFFTKSHYAHPWHTLCFIPGYKRRQKAKEGIYEEL